MSIYDANQDSKIDIKNKVVGHLGYKSFQSPTKGSKCHGKFIKRVCKVRHMLKWLYAGNDHNHISHQGLWSILPTILSLKELKYAWKEDFKATNMLK